jgi:ATP-dependent DNA helicase DinG
MSSNLIDAIASVFADGGTLADTLPGFEPRDGQRRMAEAVASVLDTGGTLLTEAGTGTGQDTRVLDPGNLSGQRVLISTGTKNLQEQIFFKDIPALERRSGVTFTATLMKGRSNYLCLQRFTRWKAPTNRAACSRPTTSSTTARRPNRRSRSSCPSSATG